MWGPNASQVLAKFLPFCCHISLGNPPTGVLQNGGMRTSDGVYVNTNGKIVTATEVSASWWLLFFCVRQLITLTFALAMQIIFIDYLSIRSGATYKVLGSWATLVRQFW